MRIQILYGSFLIKFLVTATSMVRCKIHLRRVYNACQ